jgi:hypothetical protein
MFTNRNLKSDSSQIFTIGANLQIEFDNRRDSTFIANFQWYNGCAIITRL